MIERETSSPEISMSIEEYLEDVHRLFILSFNQVEIEKGRMEALRMATIGRGGLSEGRWRETS